MVGATQLVSQAGCGYSAAVGAITARNARFAVYPLGLVGGRCGVVSVANASISGRSLLLDLQASIAPSGRLDFTPTSRPITSVGGIFSSVVSDAFIWATADSVRTVGIAPPNVVTLLRVSAGSSTLGLDFTVSGSPGMALQLSWGGSVVTSVGGFDASAFGSAGISRATSISPAGIPPRLVMSGGLVSINAAARSLALDFRLSGQPVPALNFTFSGPMLLASVGNDFLALGAPSVLLTATAISFRGVPALELGSFAVVANKAPGANLRLDFSELKNQSGANVSLPFYSKVRDISPAGVAPQAVGAATIKGIKTESVAVGGWVSSRFGVAPLVYNLRQYVRMGGVQSSAWGAAYVQGGVKQVLTPGLVASTIGAAKVVNTTANQNAYPSGITYPPLAAPSVSPRTIRPSSLFAYTSGFPVVQFPPQPRGWQSSVFGYPAIEDKARHARGEGFDSFATGYAVVRDRAQKVLHKASTVTSIFGDVAARLKSQRLGAAGFASFETSLFSEVRSTRRYVLATGLRAGEYGAAEARNKTPSLAPTGWQSLAWGLAGAGWKVRRINAAGISAPFPQAPQPSLWQTPSIKPAGIVPPAVQRPTVWPAVRVVGGLGADVARVGAITIGFAYRTIAAAGVAASAQGAQRVEHGRRTVLAAGALRDSYGSPWVSFGQRTVAPVSVVMPIDRSVPMVGGLRFLRPDGFTATRFGARIVPEVQALYPLGFAGAFGLATALNQRRFIAPAGITTFPQPAQQWGKARAFNLRQYVTQDYIEGSALTPPAWPSWTAIENRNKVMRPTGSAMAHIGAPQITNGARAILPQGAMTPGPSAATMAAYRIRPLVLDGIEAPPLSRWAVAANNAAVLAPAGLVATDFGAASAESNRRFVTRAGNIFSQWFEPPFVAPRVRSVVMDSRYGIAPPPVRLPVVQLLTRYVDVDRGGIPPKEVGRAALQIIWRGLTPRWTHRDTFGEPRLRNVTPELGARGWVAEEFGDTGVRLEWRSVAVVQGGSADVFGRTRVSDKTQRITFAGDNMMRVSDRLKVERFGVQPPGLQTITVTNGGDGPQQDFISLSFQVPKPSLNQHVIYVQQEQPHTAWGNARIDSNGILAQGYWEYLIGEPFVSLKRRELKVGKFPDAEVFEPSRPRMSPLTIWAVMEAPEQAARIQPVQYKHYINAHDYPIPVGEIFGHAVVTLKNRKLAPNSGNDYSLWGRVGQPALHNKRQYVEAGGLNAGRFGWPTVPGTRFLKVDDPPASLVFGRATVAPPPYTGPQTVAGHGASTAVFGRPVVEFRNRKLSCTGWASLVMGAQRWGDTPYAWQGLRVGPLVPTIPQGFESEAFGAAWVTLRVRGISPEGTDMFLCEYDLRQFAQRMRVRNAQSMEPPIQRVATSGHQSSVCGWQEAKPMRHYIRPDGNSNQHRKGAPVA